MPENNALRMPAHQILHPATTTLDSGGENKQTDVTQSKPKLNPQLSSNQLSLNLVSLVKLVAS